MRLGYLDPVQLAANPEAVATAVQTPPKLHRFVNKTPARLVAAAHRVVHHYGGDAGRIWGDNPTAKELQERLDAFDGIGQKKAAMAVAVLARDLGVSIRSMASSDVAYDVQIRRVFLRTGIAERDDPKHVIAAARELHPEQPSALDLPAWLVGREWCRPKAPRCSECPIEASCPKLVDRAAGVAGI